MLHNYSLRQVVFLKIVPRKKEEEKTSVLRLDN